MTDVAVGSGALLGDFDLEGPDGIVASESRLFPTVRPALRVRAFSSFWAWASPWTSKVFFALFSEWE